MVFLKKLTFSINFKLFFNPIHIIRILRPRKYKLDNIKT